MRKVNILFSFILVNLLFINQSEAFSKDPECRYYHLTGFVNANLPIDMNLIRTGDTLFGNYSVPAGQNHRAGSKWFPAGIPVQLFGKISVKGVYTIRENPWDKGAVFTGKFTPDKILKGEWKSADGITTFPFELKGDPASGDITFDVAWLQGTVPLVKKPASPRAHYQYCLLYPGGSNNVLISDSLYRVICNNFFGKPVRKVTPDMLMAGMKQSYTENYLSENAAIYQEDMGQSFNWESYKFMDIVLNRPLLLTFYIEQYSFTGGAHGLQTREYFVVNMKKGRCISLNDLFRGDYEKRLEEIITEKVRRMHDVPADAKLTDHGFFVETVKPTGNFYLTLNGIGFFYNHYEIAPYANGPDDIFIPFSDLKSLPLNETVLSGLPGF